MRAAPPAIGNGRRPYPGVTGSGNLIGIVAAEQAAAELRARRARAHGSDPVTVPLRGVQREDPAPRAGFLALAALGGR